MLLVVSMTSALPTLSLLLTHQCIIMSTSPGTGQVSGGYGSGSTHHHQYRGTRRSERCSDNTLHPRPSRI